MWTEYDGVAVARKVWNGRASLFEREAEGPEARGSFAGEARPLAGDDTGVKQDKRFLAAARAEWIATLPLRFQDNLPHRRVNGFSRLECAPQHL